MENSLHFQFGLDRALSAEEEISKAQTDVPVHSQVLFRGGGLALTLVLSEDEIAVTYFTVQVIL